MVCRAEWQGLAIGIPQQRHKKDHGVMNCTCTMHKAWGTAQERGRRGAEEKRAGKEKKQRSNNNKKQSPKKSTDSNTVRKREREKIRKGKWKSTRVR